MTKRPGFVSPTGILAAAVLVACVVAWTLIGDGGPFSPGPLNAETRDAALGGVASHAELGSDCGACHTAPWSSQTMADRCLGCHETVGDEIASGKGLHGRLTGMQSSPTCSGCHLEHNGPHGPLTSFDQGTFPHDATGFSLGTHRRTDEGAEFTCADCHPDGYAAFRDAVCADCHGGIDAAFMSRHEATYGRDCRACHDGTARDGAGFDHGATGFALTGRHAGVACRECHAGARSRQDLRQTSHACYACHAEDDEHRGSYGRACEQCHSADGWGEVTFDHAIFPLDHGSDERTAGCKTCHPSSTRTYTCYGCHEHTAANVLAKHEGRSLAALKDCVRCHPGGRGAEEG